MSQSHMSQSHIYCLPILIGVTALPELQLPLPCLSIVPHNYASRLCLSIVPHNMLMVCAQRARGDGNSPSARVMLCAARVSSSKPGGSSRIA